MRITFRLPEGWHAAPAGQAGPQDVAFAARHPQPHAGFTANITVDGAYRPDTATLAQLADESVRRMREVAEPVTVSSRSEAGCAEAPALTQKLTFSAFAGGTRRNLVQTQMHLSLLDVDEPRERSLIRLALTATVSQHDAVLSDFQQCVRTVRHDTGTV